MSGIEKRSLMTFVVFHRHITKTAWILGGEKQPSFHLNPIFQRFYTAFVTCRMPGTLRVELQQVTATAPSPSLNEMRVRAIHFLRNEMRVIGLKERSVLFLVFLSLGFVRADGNGLSHKCRSYHLFGFCTFGIICSPTNGRRG